MHFIFIFFCLLKEDAVLALDEWETAETAVVTWMEWCTCRRERVGCVSLHEKKLHSVT